MPRLSQPERDRVIGILQAGHGCLAVARVFGVYRSTITRLAERYHATGSSNDRPRTGRPRVTTGAHDRANRLAHLRDRFRPATKTAAETIGTHYRPVSGRTNGGHVNYWQYNAKSVTFGFGGALLFGCVIGLEYV